MGRASGRPRPPPWLSSNVGCPLRPGARSSARPEKAVSSEPALRAFAGLKCFPASLVVFFWLSFILSPSPAGRLRLKIQGANASGLFPLSSCFSGPPPPVFYFRSSFPVRSNRNNHRIDWTGNFLFNWKNDHGGVSSSKTRKDKTDGI